MKRKIKDLANENTPSIVTGNTDNTNNNSSVIPEIVKDLEIENSSEEQTEINVSTSETGAGNTIENVEHIEQPEEPTEPAEPIETTDTTIGEQDETAPKKRGRKLGQKNKPKELNPDNLTDIEKELGNFQETKNPVIAPEKNEVSVISGYILLTIIDSNIPFIFSFVAKLAFKQKIDAKEMKLTDKEFKELEQLADIVAKQYLTSISPIWAFSLALIGIYANKVLTIIDK